MPEHCGPPCKVIIDGRILAAAARWLANVHASLRAAALHLAETTEASVAALEHGIRARLITGDELDEAHAWSELECHRAALLRRWASGNKPLTQTSDDLPAASSELLATWAEETRLHTTKLIGGEYSGAWEVLGVNGIRKKA